MTLFRVPSSIQKYSMGMRTFEGVSHSYTWGSTMNHGRRRAHLGRNEDRLRGGFQASMLPGYSPSGTATSGTSQSNSFAGNLTGNSVTGSTSSNSTVIIHQFGESGEVESGEIGSAIREYFRALQDQGKRVEQRLILVGEKQDKINNTMKDIFDLLKKLRKESFSIKGSVYEVC